jgi:hypothetical protein
MCLKGKSAESGERSRAAVRSDRPGWLGRIAWFAMIGLAFMLFYWNLFWLLLADPGRAVADSLQAISIQFSRMDQIAFWWRLGILGALIIAVFVHRRVLRTKPHSTFTLADTLSIGEFGVLCVENMQALFQDEIRKLHDSGRLSDESLMALLQQLLQARCLLAVHEEVSIKPHLLEREVTVEDALVGASPVLVASIFAKGVNVREYRLESAQLSVLRFQQAQALLFYLGCRLLAMCDAPAGSGSGCWPDGDAERAVVTCLMAVNGLEQADALAAVEKYYKPDSKPVAKPDSKPVADIARLCRAYFAVITARRPVLVEWLADGVRPKTCRYTFRYTEAIREPDVGMPLAHWTRRRHKIRNWWNAAPKTLSIPLSRSLTAERFTLSLTVPKATYLRDVGLWDFRSGKWYPQLDRERFYASFGSWQIKPALAGVDLALSTMRSTADVASQGSQSAQPSAPDLSSSPAWLSGIDDALDRLRNPRLAVRISETPPGSIGTSALLSTSVLLMVWLCAAFFPTGKADSFDLSALALALPGAVYGVFSINGRKSLFSSVSANVCSLLSLLLSFLSILLMVAYQRHALELAAFRLPKSVMWVRDGPWLILVSVALVSAAWSGLDLLRAFTRFSALRGEEFRSNVQEATH